MLLKLVIADDGFVRRAIDGWTIDGLTEDDRQGILRDGLRPDGTPVRLPETGP